MSATKNGVLPDERDGRDQQETLRLVWRQTDRWTHESACGRYRIERFVPGLHEAIYESNAPTSRYRILKLTPNWWGEISGSETDLETCQAICEDNARL